VSSRLRLSLVGRLPPTHPIALPTCFSTHNLQAHVIMVSDLIVTPEDSPSGFSADPHHLHFIQSEHRTTGLAVAQPQPDTSHVLVAGSDGSIGRLRLKYNPFAREDESALELLPGGGACLAACLPACLPAWLCCSVAGTVLVAIAFVSMSLPVCSRLLHSAQQHAIGQQMSQQPAAHAAMHKETRCH
jgi:hypothetical protein